MTAPPTRRGGNIIGSDGNPPWAGACSRAATSAQRVRSIRKPPPPPDVKPRFNGAQAPLLKYIALKAIRRIAPRPRAGSRSAERIPRIRVLPISRPERILFAPIRPMSRGASPPTSRRPRQINPRRPTATDITPIQPIGSKRRTRSTDRRNAPRHT
jgi:hypothetical protein